MMGKNWKIYRISLIAPVLFWACAPQFVIRTRPITFSQTRIRMTREYIGRHYYLRARSIRIQPLIIVIHWTGLASMEKSYNMLNHETNQNGSELNESAHYLVGNKGEITRLMPDNWMAHHVLGLNYYAIGITNVGGTTGTDDLTMQQVEANAALIRYLVKKYDKIQYLVGHHEYFYFIGHPLYLERNYHTPPRVHDPGPKFMREVRSRVAALRLKGPDEIRQEVVIAKKHRVGYGRVPNGRIE